MPSARHGKVAQLLSQGARPGQNANVEAPCRGKVASRSAEMGVQVRFGVQVVFEDTSPVASVRAKSAPRRSHLTQFCAPEF